MKGEVQKGKGTEGSCAPPKTEVWLRHILLVL